MKIGLCGWATHRGLGIQTHEFWRAMKPERTMVLHAGPTEFDANPDMFGTDALHVQVGADHRIPERVVRQWLTGLDVVYAAESYTDWRMVRWADDAGVATICHSNPEFFAHGANPTLPHPTQWWAPTSWRLASLPGDTIVVPVPVATDRFERSHANQVKTRNDGDLSRLKVLHVGGRRAIHDRNGTDIVTNACRYLEERVDLVITSQDGYSASVMERGHGVRVQMRPGNLENYWDLYSGFDVLVMPRRYGGLSLPVQEAMAAGLAVVMPDCSPNWEWPIVPLAVSEGGWSRARMPGGDIHLASVQPRKVAHGLDALAADRQLLAGYQAKSLAWAEAGSWEALEPVYRQRLAEAIEKRR